MMGDLVFGCWCGDWCVTLVVCVCVWFLFVVMDGT